LLIISEYNVSGKRKAYRCLTDANSKRQRAAQKTVALSKRLNIPEGLSVFKLPKAHQKRLRTSNWLENLNGKIKKRTSVVGLFPSVESVLRLVSAVLMETDERWLTGKRYLNTNTRYNRKLWMA